jgi:hypothetical protein
MGLQGKKRALLPPHDLKGFQTPGGPGQFFFQVRQSFSIIRIPIRFARGSNSSGQPARLRLVFGSWFFPKAH